eukprot:scaffold3077_cov162-Amphora_coffeaeformis.AAC.4
MKYHALYYGSLQAIEFVATLPCRSCHSFLPLLAIVERSTKKTKESHSRSESHVNLELMTRTVAVHPATSRFGSEGETRSLRLELLNLERI